MPILNLSFNSLLAVLLLSLSPVLYADQAEQLDKALMLTPDIEAGKKRYVLCAACHGKDGFGEQHGEFPSISGQHQRVIIKQILDIQSKKRINPTMYPFTDMPTLGGLQGVVDISAYTAQLPANPAPVQGDGTLLDAGETLYKTYCTACHGTGAQGNDAQFYPRLTGQHYPYLVRELSWIKDKIRKNADPAMIAILQSFSESDIQAVADYLSRQP